MPTAPLPRLIRLDPAPSQMFSSLLWEEEGEEVVDEQSGKTVQPGGPCLTVKFRGTGSTWCYWPVSREEAGKVLFAGPAYDFSIGRAFSDLIRAAGKSSRQIRPAGRQQTREQGEQREQAGALPGRRWLA
jgi:hypothetical protein